MRTRRFIVSLATLGLLAGPALRAEASHSWGGYHWPRSQNPFTLPLLDSMTGDWDAYLGPVSTDWTASSVLDTPVTPSDDSTKTRKRCRAAEGGVHVCNASYGNNGWLGIAEIWITGGEHIVQARARVNDFYFSSATYNDPNAKRHVLCQEVGHTLGLDHQAAASCMDDRNGLFDPAYVDPNAHDYDELAAIYAHVDAGGSALSRGTLSPRVTVTREGNLTHVAWIIPAG